MSEIAKEITRAEGQIEYLPVSLFGSVMGLTGLSVACRLALDHFGGPAWLAMAPTAIGVTAAVVFVVIMAAYLVKLLTAFGAVQSEFRHPIMGNLFGTIPISLLQLPIVLAPYSLVLARALWITGAIGMILFAWLIVSRWMSDRQQVAQATPAWIIPVVGLLEVPVSLPALGLPSMHGLMVFGLAAGLFFAVPLFTLIFSRLLFEAPLPDALKPSLLILVAPFAVGYSSYAVTVQQNDVFEQALYMLTLFMLAILFGQLRNLPFCCPFRVSWWAISFPLAASAIAGLRYAATAQDMIADGIALALLALTTVLIVAFFIRTLLGLVRGELRKLSA